MMRALITGIDGFVGSYLAKELASHDYVVSGTSIGPSHDLVHHLLLEDRAAIEHVLQETQPDVIFHLAGFTSVAASWKAPDEAMRINRDGTSNLFAAITTTGRHPRLLISGTAEVYGIPVQSPIDEDHPVHPNNPYAESKLAQEQVARQHPDVTTIQTRSFPHIGPGQSLNFVAADFARQIVAIERGQANTMMVGNLEAIRDYTDVRDVVRAYRLLAEQGVAGEIYNVCSGHGYRIGELLDYLRSLSTQENISVTPDPTKLRPSDIPSLIGNNAKLRTATGWSPTVDIRDTLGELLAMYRQQV